MVFFFSPAQTFFFKNIFYRQTYTHAKSRDVQRAVTSVFHCKQLLKAKAIPSFVSRSSYPHLYFVSFIAWVYVIPSTDAHPSVCQLHQWLGDKYKSEITTQAVKLSLVFRSSWLYRVFLNRQTHAPRDRGGTLREKRPAHKKTLAIFYSYR